MQNTYTAKQIDAWLEHAAKDLPSKGLASYFGNVLKSLSRRASLTLNKITLMAILERVLFRCKEKYPLLDKLKVDIHGISLEEFSSQFDQTDPAELTRSFQFLFHEFLDVLGNLTAEIVTTSLQYQQKPFLSLVEYQADDVNLKWVNYAEDQSTQRLERLYDISKYFATFESVEKTFPEIIMVLETLFSFKSIVLLEKKNGTCVSSLWYDAKADQECIEHALTYAKTFYEYLVCPLTVDPSGESHVLKYELPICSLVKDQSHDEVMNKYITLPLTLSSLENFGILQFESLAPITESDLRFISALSNLIAVSLDRFNKEKEANLLREIEMSERSNELMQAHRYASSLEQERELREQFVATLTHDLRTPLTAAKMGAQFILRRPDNVEKNQQLAVKIIRSVDRMDQMIRDLLDANRIRAG
ncbi:MAG: histidine kinase dimerization/phospho-acceptor domain-containing protein, partial [Bacteriovorax sp.]